MTDPTKIPDEVVERAWQAFNDYDDPDGKVAPLKGRMRAALAAAGFAELREDAERYRWWRDTVPWPDDVCEAMEFGGAKLDAATDAARKGE